MQQYQHANVKKAAVNSAAFPWTFSFRTALCRLFHTLTRPLEFAFSPCCTVGQSPVFAGLLRLSWLMNVAELASALVAALMFARSAGVLR